MKSRILKFLSSELFKFIIVGGLSAVIEFALLILFVEALSINYLIGNIVAFCLTNIITYILTKRYVFNNTSSNNSNSSTEAILFAVCLAGALLLNQAVLWALVELTTIDYRIAKVLAIMVSVVWNFFTRKYLVFKNRTVAAQQSTRDY